jgi:uncharacterized protein YdbL (DUF1318 family)
MEYATLDLGEDTKEILANEQSDAEVAPLREEIELFSEEMSYQQVEGILTQLEQSAAQEVAAWVPKDPEKLYTVFQTVAARTLRSVAPGRAERFETGLHQRLGKENKEEMTRESPELIGLYQQSLTSLTAEYARLQGEAGKKTANLMELDGKLSTAERALEKINDRLKELDPSVQGMEGEEAFEAAQQRFTRLYEDRGR